MALDVASRRDVGVVEPDAILRELAGLAPHLYEEAYYSERALFYNPGRSAPLGVIFAAVKDHDGPNDIRSELSRPGVFRLAFQLTRQDYEARLGRPPGRPSKGGRVVVPDDVTALDELTPHPVYAWMRWVQVLCPSRQTLDSLRPFLEASLESVKARWYARPAAR